MYELKIDQSLKIEHFTPHIFRLLKIDHYLSPLRDYLIKNDREDIYRLIEDINLKAEDLISEIIVNATEDYWVEDDDSIKTIIGPYEVTFYDPEEIINFSPKSVEDNVSFSDFYIFMADRLALGESEISPSQVLLIAALSLYSSFEWAVIDSEEFPLYQGRSTEHDRSFDEVAKINLEFANDLIDFPRLVDAYYRFNQDEIRPKAGDKSPNTVPVIPKNAQKPAVMRVFCLCLPNSG